ncbi:MAG: TetR/AcrR family transcriptional regulator [Roseiarcus sp.]|jgi:AcrR family transcriptional regulator
MKIVKRPYDLTSRAAKAEATRERILEQAVQLYREWGTERFTLDEIARHAGTTVQTVLRAYASKDKLLLRVLDRLAAGGAEWLKPTEPGDIAAAVGAIFDVYETIGDLVMRELGEESRLPALKPALDRGRANHCAWVKELFAPQLGELTGAARAARFAVFVVATDVYVWKKLRRDLALSRREAEAIVLRMIKRDIQREDDHGSDSLAELVGRREPAA